MSRLIHRVGTMIACVFERRALLLLPADFSSLVGRLSASWSPVDSVGFRHAVLHNLGGSNARKKLPQWEREFLAYLQDAIASNAFDPCYRLTGEDARMHIDDYLEAFRASFRYISVASAAMHDHRDVIYNVAVRDKQGLKERVLGRYGPTTDEWNFLKSEVAQIEGSSLNFKATIGRVEYHFTPQGVRRISMAADA